MFSLFALLLSVHSVLFAEIGFYEDLPEQPLVRDQKTKVYRGYFPTLPLIKVSKEDLVAIDLNTIVADPERAKGDPNRLEFNDAVAMLARRQIEMCLERPKEDCFVLSGAVRGSLFFVEDQSTFYTAFHNIQKAIAIDAFKKVNEEKIKTHAYLKLSEASHIVGDVKDVEAMSLPSFAHLYKAVRQQRGSVIIYNSDSEIIFGDRAGDWTVATDFMPEHLYSIFDIEMLSALTDFARIKLNKSIGEVLAVSEGLKDEGGAYVLGYPHRAQRDSFSKPSADGLSMYFTKGQFLSEEGILEKFGLQDSELSDRDTFMKRVSACDCDGYYGNSGGVAVNNRGEASFIMVSAYPPVGEAISEDNIMMYGLRVSVVRSYFQELEKKLSMN